MSAKPYKLTATRPLKAGYVKRTISYNMAYPPPKGKAPRKKRAPAASKVVKKKGFLTVIAPAKKKGTTYKPSKAAPVKNIKKRPLYALAQDQKNLVGY